MMLNGPFYHVALPLMVAFVVTIWYTSHSQNLLLKDIITRLTRIENLLSDHDKRITTLEASRWK
jgi:hypothetical protein